MTVLILYNQPSGDRADADVLTQLAWVRCELDELGYQTEQFEVTLDLTPLDRVLRAQRPESVVYLVESLAGTDSLLHLPAHLLEAHDVPFTGSSGTVLKSLTSKSNVKQRLLSAGLPTPAWLDVHGKFYGQFAEGPYIIKADREHASRGLDQTSVMEAKNVEELRRLCEERSRLLRLPCLAERFVPGREFNIALLDHGDGSPAVLPLAEINFAALPSEHVPIVDWNAKWAEDSVEYNGTPRSFPNMCTQPQLHEQLQGIAARCWQLFGVTGFARVDVRVDSNDQAWILEINANPCLSPDAGFLAACHAARLASQEVMQRLLTAAMSNSNGYVSRTFNSA